MLSCKERREDGLDFEKIEGAAWDIIRTLKLPDSDIGACRWIARNYSAVEINEALMITRDRMDTPETRPRVPIAYFRGVLKKRREELMGNKE